MSKASELIDGKLQEGNATREVRRLLEDNALYDVLYAIATYLEEAARDLDPEQRSTRLRMIKFSKQLEQMASAIEEDMDMFEL